MLFPISLDARFRHAVDGVSAAGDVSVGALRARQATPRDDATGGLLGSAAQRPREKISDTEIYQ